MRINQSLVDRLAKTEYEQIKTLFEGVEVYGGKNLEKLKDKKVLYLPNHLSHIDYTIIPIILNQHGLKHPAIITGSNLKKESTKYKINEETGVIFIDRYIAQKGTRDEKLREASKKKKGVEEIVKKGYSLMVFIEGTREYEKKVMEKVYLGYVRDYILETKNQNKKTKDFLICPIAISYSRGSFEKRKKTRLKKSKEKAYSAKAKGKEKKYERKNKRYEKLDEKALRKQLKKKEGKKGIIKINIGEPFPLEEYFRPGGWMELGKVVQNKVKTLYSELQDINLFK